MSPLVPTWFQPIISNCGIQEVFTVCKEVSMPKFEFSKLIRSLFPVSAKRQSRCQKSLRLEQLEQRCLLTASVLVNPVANLTTTESGGTAQFTVVLTEQPTKPVKIPVKSSDVTEGTVGVKLLTFNKDNWNQPQTVTVKGIDDLVTDGNQPYTIVLGPAKGDKIYKKFDPADVSLSNQDDDVPGIQVVAGNNLQTTEGGGTATFTIKLATKPTANVTIPIQSSNTLEGSVTSSVTFTPLNWNKAQTVTITGVNDSLVDGDQPYDVIFGAATSTDSNYAGRTATPLSVTNHDNDVAGLQVSPVSAFSLFEGGTRDISVKLTAKPTAEVTVTIAETVGADQATLSTTTLTFTPDNWNVNQKVTVTGSLGDGTDDSKAYAFTLTAASGDEAFNVLPPTTINITIVDTDDQPHNLDGRYTGEYEGKVRVFGIDTPQSGTVEFTVVGNNVTVTKPAEATGTITDGSGTFAPTSGPLVGGSFTGTFTENEDGSVSVSGTWIYDRNGNTGSGVWSAFRPAVT